MSEFYKTNDDSLSITVEEFVNEWYNKQEYMLVDIRESEERTEKGVVKVHITYLCMKYLTR